MGPFLLLFFFHLGFSSQIGSVIPEAVRAGYFRGRSGNIVFKELQDQAIDASIIVLDPLSHLEVLDNSASLSGYEVADIMTSSLGLEKLNPNVETPSIVGQDMFNPAQANILFAIESLGNEMAAKMNLPNLGGSGGALEGTIKSLDLNFYPASSLTVLASLLSGTPPALHGIVGRSWRSKAEGQIVEAFSSQTSGSQVANVADVLSQTFPRSFSLSVSSDRQLAAVSAVNFALDNSSSCLVSLEQRGFQINSGSNYGRLSLSKNQILANLKDLEDRSCLNAFTSDSARIHVEINNDLVSVDFPSAWGEGSDSATFDLRNQADYTFFAELQYIHQLPDLLTAQNQVPQLYSLVLAAPTGLIDEYGRESPEVRAAFHLLDAWFPQAIQKWFDLFDNDAVAQVVLLGSHQSSLQSAATRDVLDKLLQIMPTEEGIEDFFPSLYLDDKQALRFCKAESDLLPVTVQPYGFGVYCPWLSLATSRDALYRPTSLFSLGVSANGTNTTGPTSNAIERYQVALWISIIMAFAVYWAVYSTVFMSFKKDTMLYSSFNPNWEDRKRR